MGVGNGHRRLRKNKEDKKISKSSGLASAWLGPGKPHTEEAAVARKRKDKIANEMLAGCCMLGRKIQKALASRL